MRSTKPHVTRRRRRYGSRAHEIRTRRGNAALCPRCGGVGTVWTGAERITCPKCGGTGRKPVE